MGIIQDNARIQHQTITTPGATFSLPPQEDYTIAQGSSASWNIIGDQLCLSEIGVNESDGKAFIRIGSDIKEFQFSAGIGTTGSLSAVLAVGNETGANNIIMSTGSVLLGLTSNSIDLNLGGGIYINQNNNSSIYMTSDIDILSTNNISIIGSNDISISSVASSLIYVNNQGILIQDNSTATQSSPNVNGYSTFINTNNSRMSNGVTNSVVIGGYGLNGTESNTVYMQNLYVQGQFATGTPAITTKYDGTVQLYNVTFATGSGITLANVLAVGSDPVDQPITGTFAIHNVQGPDAFVIESLMQAGGTQATLTSQGNTRQRQRSGTSSGTQSLLIDTVTYDGNGALIIDAYIIGVNNDWGDVYTCHLYASIADNQVMPGLSGPSITKDEKFIWTSATFAATASMVYANGTGGMDLVVYSGTPGMVNWYLDYKLISVTNPV